MPTPNPAIQPGAIPGRRNRAWQSSAQNEAIENRPIALANKVIGGGGLTPNQREYSNRYNAIAGGVGLPSTQGIRDAAGSWNNSQFQTANDFYNNAVGGAYGTDANQYMYNLAQNPGNAQEDYASGVFRNFAGGNQQISGDALQNMFAEYTRMNPNVSSNVFQNLMRQTGNVNARVGTDDFERLGNEAQQLGQNADDLLGGIASGRQGINTGQKYNAIYQQAKAPGAAERFLTGTAKGNDLHGNPYFMKLLEDQTEKAGEDINNIFAGSGRYGSGAHQGVMGETLGDMRLKGLSENYGREREYQMQAARDLEAAQNAGIGQELQATAGLTGVQGQNIGNRMAATGQMLDAQNAGLGMQRGIYGDIAGIDQGNINNAFNQLNQQGQFGRDIAGIDQGNINNQFNQMGARTGIANTLTGLEGQNLDRQMAGANQLANIGGTLGGRQLAALGQGGQFDLANAQNQFQGAGQLAGLGQNAFNNQLTGAQATFGADQSNLQNRFNAMGQGSGMENSGLGTALGYINSLPTIRQNPYHDELMQIQGGAMGDQIRQQQYDDMLKAWGEGDMRDWGILGALQAAAQGAAGPYGRSWSQTTTQQPMNLPGMLGSLFSMFAPVPA